MTILRLSSKRSPILEKMDWAGLRSKSPWSDSKCRVSAYRNTLEAGQLYVSPAGEPKAPLFAAEIDHLLLRVAPVEFFQP